MCPVRSKSTSNVVVLARGCAPCMIQQDAKHPVTVKIIKEMGKMEPIYPLFPSHLFGDNMILDNSCSNTGCAMQIVRKPKGIEIRIANHIFPYTDIIIPRDKEIRLV